MRTAQWILRQHSINRLMLLFISFALSLWALFFLTGCHGSYGNVVPQTGPTMAQVYDDMSAHQNQTQSKKPSLPEKNTLANQNVDADSNHGEDDLSPLRRETITQNTATSTPGFKKIPNPELSLYVYPHLAGESEIPIPGYSTAFNAYDRDHYALPQDTVR